jgi:hypothetical protein
MKSWFRASALVALMVSGACRHRPVVDANHPYESEQNAARERVEARGRYDVEHNPNDTMSVNSMGSD